MAQFCSFYHTAKNPSITVTGLPFSRTLSLARVSEIYTEVFKHPIVAKDLARWNATLLMPTPLPQYNIVSKGKAIQQLADFKGLRVRGSGVIDATSFAPHAHLATKSYKVGKWYTTNLNLGSANCPVVVNTDALNSLKPVHREALLGSVDEALAYYVENYQQNTTGKYQAAVTEDGLTQVTFTAEQTVELNKLSESVRSEWIKKYADKFDSQALFDFTAELFAE
jgi:TRAP-type C4-dicarboxylate transport system substrate-binding protein